MCGIVGIFGYGPASAQPREAELVAIRDAMSARGPDGYGMWRDPQGRILLGHRRLAIIDVTTASAQPMEAAEGAAVITFNGEIYNYRELRAELQAEGAVFRTTGDTEVLLQLYLRHGAAMVERLDGMFAFGIWDAAKRKLFLARDPYGIKPLYYADRDGVFRFASSVKALMRGGAVSRDIDPAGIVGFFGWGSVPEPRTVYRDVRSLPAGSTAWVDADGLHTPARYWSPARVYARSAGTTAGVPSREQVTGVLRDALADSVRRHLLADVPVGLFLSAGFDSTALLGLAKEFHDGPVRTVTLAFDEFRGTHDDEAPVAERVARDYGAEHVTHRVRASDMMAEMAAFLDAMDQPTVDGLNVYWVSRAAHAAGLKAAICGLGGDELLGGYATFPRFVWMGRLREAASMSRGASVAQRLLHLLPESPRRAKAAYAFQGLKTPESSYHVLRGLFMPEQLRVLVSPDIWESAGGLDALLEPVRGCWDASPDGAWGAVAAAEQSMYMRNQLLRDADWASMAHSLEVRVPLVDRRLTEQVGQLVARTRGRYGKHILAAAVSPELPLYVTRRKKTGFSLPMRAWMRQMLRDQALPMPTSSVVQTNPRTLSTTLLADLDANRAHWSRAWAFMVLGSYLA